MEELKLSFKAEKHDYLQAKYDYYKTFNTILVVACCFAMLSYLIFDGRQLGHFPIETLFARSFCLIPMIIFLIAAQATNNYNIMTCILHIILHCMLWCTVFAVYYLPDRSYISEGILTIQLIFLGASFGTPIIFSTISNWFVLVEIVISNNFVHYGDTTNLVLLNIPCLIGITCTSFAMSNVFNNSFKTKKHLETSLVIDPLTNTYNRNILPKLAKNGRLTFDRTGDVSILLLDIDHFKEINDSYGHAKGDTVLQFIADSIQSCVRGNDYVLRWGGEEFVVFMPACVKSEAIKVAERIRTKIEKESQDICPITISIGVAEYDNENYVNAIKNADKALYVAKQTGRNRVVCYAKGITTGVLYSNGFED